MLLLLALACSEPAPAPPPPAPPPAPKVDVAKVEVKVLAPSPEETRQAVERAGIATPLASLVPPRAFSAGSADPDRAALRTGVLVADLVLTCEKAPKDEVKFRLQEVRAGLAAMNAGAGLLSTMDELIAGAENESISRKELVTRLDEIAGMADPGQGVGPSDRSGPLLQAGAWLAGANLVATAGLKEGRAAEAGQVLRQAEVVAWFLTYVSTEGKEKTDAELASLLETTLKELKAIAEKPTIEAADLEIVKARTQALIDLI